MRLPLKIATRTYGTSDWQLASEGTPCPARLQLRLKPAPAHPCLGGPFLGRRSDKRVPVGSDVEKEAVSKSVRHAHRIVRAVAKSAGKNGTGADVPIERSSPSASD